MTPSRFFLPFLALVSLLACARERAEAEEPVVLAHSMLEVLAPRTNDIIGVLIDSRDAEGNIAPANLSEEDWAAMEDAVASLHDETIALRDRPIQVVAHPGDSIFGEETSGLSAADVQAMIEAERDDFDFYVEIFLADIVAMRDAMTVRDAPALWLLADEIDHKCEACHEQFWYPNWQEEALPPR